jgi:hypothetical protein
MVPSQTSQKGMMPGGSAAHITKAMTVRTVSHNKRAPICGPPKGFSGGEAAAGRAAGARNTSGAGGAGAGAAGGTASVRAATSRDHARM